MSRRRILTRAARGMSRSCRRFTSTGCSPRFRGRFTSPYHNSAGRSTAPWRDVFHRLTHSRAPDTVPGDRWGRFALATPAQALVDTMYASVHRGRPFAYLPEIELPVAFAPSEPGARRRSPPAQMARLFREVGVLIAGIQRPAVRGAVRTRWSLLQASIRHGVLATGE